MWRDAGRIAVDGGVVEIAGFSHGGGFPAADRRDLVRAVSLLETPRLAARIANQGGAPIDAVLHAVPPLHQALMSALRPALLRCLTIAVESQDEAFHETPAWLPKLAVGVTGVLGGLFGAIALPIELPFTLMLMLRAIADIARRHGEDPRMPEPRLACLEVLALGSGKTGMDGAFGYLGARLALRDLTRDVVLGLAGGRVLDGAAPAVARLIAEIAARLGLALSERAAAAALPILGVLGSVTLNVVFMDHFARVAEGHFTVRRLERRHGEAAIRAHYRAAAA